MAVCVLAQDGLYLAVDLLLQDNPQELQGLSRVRHHRVVISRHCHLQVLAITTGGGCAGVRSFSPHLMVWPEIDGSLSP